MAYLTSAFAIIFKFFFNLFYVLLLQKHPIYSSPSPPPPKKKKLSPNFHLLFLFNRNSEARIWKLKTSLTNLEHWCGMLTPWWLLNQAGIPQTTCLNITERIKHSTFSYWKCCRGSRFLSFLCHTMLPCHVVWLTVPNCSVVICEKVNWFQNYVYTGHWTWNPDFLLKPLCDSLLL